MSQNRLETLIDDYLAHCLSEGRRRNTVENAYVYAHSGTRQADHPRVWRYRYEGGEVGQTADG